MPDPGPGAMTEADARAETRGEALRAGERVVIAGVLALIGLLACIDLPALMFGVDARDVFDGQIEADLGRMREAVRRITLTRRYIAGRHGSDRADEQAAHGR